MNRERAQKLLRDANEALTLATSLRSLLEGFPSWDEIGNFLNLVDGVDEIRAKVKVLELFADESISINEDDLNRVVGWLTQEED